MRAKNNLLSIGVLDSGIGGLTVMSELMRLMPMENIVYYGDNANCPYGNRSKDEILQLTISALDFLQERGVKIAAIACNTISTLIDGYRERYEFPIVSIVEAACAYTAGLGVSNVGVFATEFTVKESLYKTLIQRHSPDTKVYELPSRTLAGLIDSGGFDSMETKTEVQTLLDTLLAKNASIRHVVLGCTHYPIVNSLFQNSAPGITFINPAKEQAKSIYQELKKLNLLKETTEHRCDIFTNGGTEALYSSVLERLDVREKVSIHINL